MKIKIFLVWLLAIMTLPLYMGIPVVGKWLVVIFIVGPMLLPILKWAFSYHEGAEHLNFQSPNTNNESGKKLVYVQDPNLRVDRNIEWENR